MRGQVAFGGGYQFGGDDFAVEIVDGVEAAAGGHGQHPADFAEALLGVDEVGHGDNLRFIFRDPIQAGEARVEDAVFDVARHFLGADEHALDIGIVDGREVGAAAGGDVKAGAAEQIDGRVFQAAFGNAEFQFHALPPYTALGS